MLQIVHIPEILPAKRFIHAGRTDSHAMNEFTFPALAGWDWLYGNGWQSLDAGSKCQHDGIQTQCCEIRMFCIGCGPPTANGGPAIEVPRQPVVGVQPQS